MHQDQIPVNQRPIEDGVPSRRIKEEIGQGTADNSDVAECHCSPSVKVLQQSKRRSSEGKECFQVNAWLKKSIVQQWYRETGGRGE